MKIDKDGKIAQALRENANKADMTFPSLDGGTSIDLNASTINPDDVKLTKKQRIIVGVVLLTLIVIGTILLFLFFIKAR